jgi:hypothetical protein
LVHGEVA